MLQKLKLLQITHYLQQRKEWYLFNTLSKPGAPILPPVSKLKEASKLVPISVISETVKQGLNSEEILDATEAVKKEIWNVNY